MKQDLLLPEIQQARPRAAGFQHLQEKNSQRLQLEKADQKNQDDIIGKIAKEEKEHQKFGCGTQAKTAFSRPQSQ